MKTFTEAIVKSHISKKEDITLKMFAIWFCDIIKDETFLEDSQEIINNKSEVMYRRMFFNTKYGTTNFNNASIFVKTLKDNENEPIKIKENESKTIRLEIHNIIVNLVCDVIPSNKDILKTYHKYVK